MTILEFGYLLTNSEKAREILSDLKNTFGGQMSQMKMVLLLKLIKIKVERKSLQKNKLTGEVAVCTLQVCPAGSLARAMREAACPPNNVHLMST